MLIYDEAFLYLTHIHAALIINVFIRTITGSKLNIYRISQCHQQLQSLRNSGTTLYRRRRNQPDLMVMLYTSGSFSPLRVSLTDPRTEEPSFFHGCSLGRVTKSHHSGGRSPSLRAGGRASVLGPSGGVSATS